MSNKVTTSDAQKFLKSALADAARALAAAAKALDSVDHQTASLALYYSDLSAVVENFIGRFVEVTHVKVLPPSLPEPPPVVIPKAIAQDPFAFDSLENSVSKPEAPPQRVLATAKPRRVQSVVAVVPASSSAAKRKTPVVRTAKETTARKRRETDAGFIVQDIDSEAEADEYTESQDDDDVEASAGDDDEDDDENVDDKDVNESDADDDDVVVIGGANDDDDDDDGGENRRTSVDEDLPVNAVVVARQQNTRDNAVSQFFGNSSAYDVVLDTMVTFARLPEDFKWSDERIVVLTGRWTRQDLAKWTSAKWFKDLMETVRVAANNGTSEKYKRLMTLLNLALFGRVSMQRVQREETRVCGLCSREKVSRYAAHIESPFPEEVFEQMSAHGWHVESGRCDLVFGSNCAEMALRAVYFGSTVNDARRWLFHVLGLAHDPSAKAKEFNDVHHFDQRILLAHAALKEVVEVLKQKGRSLVNTDLAIGKNTPPIVRSWVK